MKTTWHFLISGKVQGVGYRRYTQDMARLHSLSGWVRNLRDGRVEVMATGEATALQAFHAILLKGPRHGRVDDIQRKDVDRVEEFKGFLVLDEGDG